MSMEHAEIVATPNTLAYQAGNSGSNPTSPLQYRIRLVTRQELNPLIEKYHYSHGTNGVNGKLNFGLFAGELLIGAAIVGQPATPNVAAKYSDGGMLKVVELRRFALVDEAPKNSESYFLSKICWWLRKNTDFDKVISFADETYGHIGTIYKAANWKQIGVSRAEKRIEWQGRRYHRRALWQHARPQQMAAIKAAIASGDAKIIQTGSKRVFQYMLR